MPRRTIHAILLRAVAPALLLTLGAATALATATVGEAGPRLVVPEAVWDAGKVAPGEKIVHDFEIRNEGTAPLAITDVRPACGCTVAEFDATIAPGATGKVHAVLDTASFRGAIAKGITVLTDDPAQPRIELTMKATVEPRIFVEPGFARFIQPQLSDPGTVEQRVFTASFDDLRILAVESPYPFLEVTHSPLPEELWNENGVGRQHHLVFTLDYGKAPMGPLAGYVIVRTNHPLQPELQIPVSGFVRPMLVVTPREADFGEIEIEKPITATMVLKNYARDLLKVTGAESTVEGVAVEIEQVEEGREWSVLLTLDPTIGPGAFSGTIRLRTDHPKQPLIEIPLKGTAV